MRTEMGEEITLPRKRPPASRDAADEWFFTRVRAEVHGERFLAITFVITSLERTRKALDPSMRTEVSDETAFLRKRPPASRDAADERLLTGVRTEVPGETTLVIRSIVTVRTLMARSSRGRGTRGRFYRIFVSTTRSTFLAFPFTFFGVFPSSFSSSVGQLT